MKLASGERRVSKSTQWMNVREMEISTVVNRVPMVRQAYNKPSILHPLWLFLDLKHVTHSNGRMEKYHKFFKNECNESCATIARRQRAQQISSNFHTRARKTFRTFRNKKIADQHSRNSGTRSTLVKIYGSRALN